jgi:hypothetical protein
MPCTASGVLARLEADTAGIDPRSLGVVATAFFADQGVCRPSVVATFDTPELRAAHESLGDAVVSFVFQPAG